MFNISKRILESLKLILESLKAHPRKSEVLSQKSGSTFVRVSPLPMRSPTKVSVNGTWGWPTGRFRRFGCKGQNTEWHLKEQLCSSSSRNIFFKVKEAKVKVCEWAAVNQLDEQMSPVVSVNYGVWETKASLRPNSAWIRATRVLLHFHRVRKSVDTSPPAETKFTCKQRPHSKLALLKTDSPAGRQLKRLQGSFFVHDTHERKRCKLLPRTSDTGIR